MLSSPSNCPSAEGDRLRRQSPQWPSLTPSAPNPVWRIRILFYCQTPTCRRSHSMRQKDRENTDEETSQVASDLYLPSWAEQNTPSQPLATALPLELGKNLCLQNCIQRCRTIRLRLPAEQQAEVSSMAIE